MKLHMILAGKYWNSRFQPIILWCVLSIRWKTYVFYDVFWGRRELSTVKYICDFLKFQTVWCESIGFELPRGGGRTDARTHGGIISFELSPLARCMKIKSTKGCPRVTEIDWEWSPNQDNRWERGMWGREGRVKWGSQECIFSWEILIFDDFSYDFSWEVLKCTISTYHCIVCLEHLTKKVLILCCVLRATVAKYCKIHTWFSEIQTVWCKSIGFELPRGGGTHGRTEE